MHNILYLTERQLAELTHRSIKSWQRDRIRGGGIPFIKCGGKILYDMSDIEKWMNDRKFNSTSAYAGGE
tara:strand:- start:1559 stop:1765 length:207 start_codon:yes stop_codon:yes gene_type:complete